MVELDERFMQHTVVRFDADGHPRVDCVPELEQALSLVRRRLDSLRVSRGEAR
jgi:hypothetical protein